MKKLFISQPMRDKTDEEIKRERELIIDVCSQKFGEIEAIGLINDAPYDAKPLWYLGQSLILLSEADIVYFAPN